MACSILDRHPNAAAQGRRVFEMHPSLAMYAETLASQSVHHPEGGAYICHMGPEKKRRHASDPAVSSPEFVSWAACFAANMGLR